MNRQREDWPAIGADLFFVVLFTWIGRNSHGESLTVGEVAWTALPFAAAALITHLVLFMRRIDVRSLKIGAIIWASTWLLGMVLRALTGGGTAPSFIAVAGAVLLLMIVGWRLVYWLVTRHSAARQD